MVFPKIAKNIFGLLLATAALIGTYVLHQSGGAMFTVFLVFLGGLICIIRNVVDSKSFKNDAPLYFKKSTYLLDFGIVCMALSVALLVLEKINS